MRTVEEWIGKTDDEAPPPRVKLRVFERFEGRCQCGCNRKITAGEKWQTDHCVALVNGGSNRESNLWPMLTEHHKNKTAADVAEKSRNYKRRSTHVGIKKRPYPWGYGKHDRFKKKIGGAVVPRV